jgi:thiol:disulfide interchange protein DsbD
MRSLSFRVALILWAAFILFYLLCTCCPAADGSLVKATPLLSKDKIRPGDLFKVAFRVSIAPGYHVNGKEIADPLLIPTELRLEEQANFLVEEYLYPTPRSAKFSFSESELLVYEGNIIIALLIQAGKELAIGPQKLKGKLIYQACDNVTCFPPCEVQIEIPLKIVPSSEETKDINQDVFDVLEFKKDKKQVN